VFVEVSEDIGISNEEWDFNAWLIQRLEAHSLAESLAFLLTDTDHLAACFHSRAFINSEEHQNSMMACVLAIENKDSKLLKHVDQTLLEAPQLEKTPFKIFQPQFVDDEKVEQQTKVTATKKLQGRRWKSLPNLNHSAKIECRARSNSSSTAEAILVTKLVTKAALDTGIAVEASNVPYFQYQQGLSSGKTHNVPVVNISEIPIHTDYRLTTMTTPTSENHLAKPSSFKKFFNFFESVSESQLSEEKKKSKLHAVSSSPTDLFFRSPVAGEKIHQPSIIAQSVQESGRKRKSSKQKLQDLIHSVNSCSRSRMELDHENAHFHLSEAIIITSQQIKFNKLLEKYKIPKFTPREDFSSAQQKPPLKPLPPHLAKRFGSQLDVKPKFTVGSLEDDTVSGSSSSSTDDVSGSQRKLSISSDECNDMTAATATPQMEWTASAPPSSAEAIAMLLLSKFQQHQMPNPRNLRWLVSDSQVPEQQLLPMPDLNSINVNPDDQVHLNTFIRGSKDWAPPRQQIIFTTHPVPDRKRKIMEQVNRCAGCGMKVSSAYVSRFRYCDYFDKVSFEKLIKVVQFT